ncbi:MULTISPECIES: hypothetical protein [Streptomyces]|uniref:Secreted protein n=1 Tax=Streptomyces venezuelae TaxID=54571 RepID=A0A5P2BKQ6_STRVZ|nr:MULTISPECIES: hypothetical protein [Streptomyces]NEA00111.1 hypothetical protein [Streptomyces sp. SID10116]MYY79870.1 hypothetical protein [Streptomyces sp. SID335]MYZ12869.1 hypothetical protein [Streptomyces sp. SID337]NDZ87474.1 hypothetical protein [Streptomyces sp. SID10115]NEB43359.1 hypothetical protein [Streptomyces sp. SID339]
MNNTTRVLAAVAFTGAAALSFSGVAQAQESDRQNPLPVGDVTKEVIGVYNHSVAPAVQQQVHDTLHGGM